MLLIGLISIFYFAIVLLIIGLLGRRVCDEPRCCKCKYNLTGAVSANCPECGTILSERTIGWGVKKVRPVVTGMGALLIAAQITFLYATYNRATWLQYYPFQIVLVSAKGGDVQAVQELARRHKIRWLDNRQREQIIESAIESIEARYKLLSNSQANNNIVLVPRSITTRRSKGGMLRALPVPNSIESLMFLFASDNLLSPSQIRRLQRAAVVPNPFPRPLELERFDGIQLDYRFDSNRGKWMPSDRIQTEPFRSD